LGIAAQQALAMTKHLMTIAERSRSLPIIFSTLVVGLSPLIPIPVVDDLITAALCRWRVKYLAAQYGLTLTKEEIKTLADLQQSGCVSGVAERTFGYAVRAFFQNLLFWLEAGRVANLLAESYYDGVLLDYAFAERLHQPGSLAEAERLRKNIILVRYGANFRQLQDLLKHSSSHTRRLATQFMRDVYEQYFRDIPKVLHKRWRQLRKRPEEFSAQADQDTKQLNESAAGWRERYKPLFDEFARAITEISPREIERLCLALADKMNRPNQPTVGTDLTPQP
jgi:hypothetical protein